MRMETARDCKSYPSRKTATASPLILPGPAAARYCFSLIAIEAIAVDVHAVPDANAVEVLLHEGGLAAIAELDHDAIGFAAIAVALDLVAGARPTDGARRGSEVVAAAAAELVADHATHDAAHDGA